MRLGSRLSRVCFISTVFAAGILTGYLTIPVYKSALLFLWQQEFTELTFLCDQSMREHFVAKQKVASNPSEGTVAKLRSAEISLLSCQDYDLFQKKMIRWGLTDNEVGEMILIATEQRGEDLRRVVRTHEIRY